MCGGCETRGIEPVFTLWIGVESADYSVYSWCMKKLLIGFAGAVLFVAGSAAAQTGAVGVQVNAQAASSSAKGNIEVNVNAGDGESPERPEEATTKPERPVQAQGTTTSMKGGVSVAAGDVDGLTEEEKEAFLLSVKTHAQVRSEQDLANFAKGVLLKDDAVEEVAYTDEEITVEYKGKGKLLGFLPVGFSHRVSVDTDAPAAEKVKVHFPWYSFLLKTGLSAEEIETEIAANLSADLTAGAMGTRVSAYAKAFTTIANVLKAHHAAAQSSASVE